MMTKTNSKTIHKARFLLVLPLLALVVFVFSCEREEVEFQRLGNSENEELTQVPMNEIPSQATPRVDDPRMTPGITSADEVFDEVENPPLPAGGVEGWNQYLASTIKYPASAREKGIEGMVVVAFVVDREGKITNAEILKGIGGGCDEEALRVINASPNWEPGIQRGREVNVRMRLPIKFKLAGGNNSDPITAQLKDKLLPDPINTLKEIFVVGYSPQDIESYEEMRNSIFQPKFQPNEMVLK